MKNHFGKKTQKTPQPYNLNNYAFLFIPYFSGTTE